jgi:REP element-mobilizing transposase RayT
MQLIASLKVDIGGVTGAKNPMLYDNLSRIIRWYKGRCSFDIRKTHPDFEWQARFHDNIIRDETQYQRIKSYIINNPLKWSEDKFFSND